MTFDRIIYCFNSDSHLLFEVKSRDKDEKLYQWYLYDSIKDDLLELDFISMSDNKREFKQGNLVFDEKNATLTLSNQKLSFDKTVFNINSKEMSNMFINVLAKSTLVNRK